MAARIEKETDLRRAIALEPTRTGQKPDGEEWPEVLQYTGHVQYVEQLRRYESFFPPEQMMVIIYDDFRGDNEGRCAGASLPRCRGRGADRGDGSEPRRPVALGSGGRDGPAVDLGQGPAARVVKKAARAMTPRSLRRKSYQVIQDRLVFGSPQPADEELMLELRRRFRPEVEALSAYLNVISSPSGATTAPAEPPPSGSSPQRRAGANAPASERSD